MGTDTASTNFKVIYADGAPALMINLGSVGWHHVVFVADGTTCFGYVDGSLASQAAQAGDIATFTNWRLGNAYGDATRRFTGKLDDARVYNRALTQEEIPLIMEGGL